MPTAAGHRNARVMDNASARNQLVGALADRMRGNAPAAYASALTQIEALNSGHFSGSTVSSMGVPPSLRPKGGPGPSVAGTEPDPLRWGV